MHKNKINLIKIFFCNQIKPNINDSADGGQPGINISTGIIRSQPLSTEYEK